MPPRGDIFGQSDPTAISRTFFVVQDGVTLNIVEALKIDPAWLHQHLQFLGMAHFLEGNYETAARLYRERISLARDIGRTWLSSSLGHLGDHAKARKIWADLLEINPNYLLAPRLGRYLFARPMDPESVMAGLAKAGRPT